MNGKCTDFHSSIPITAYQSNFFFNKNKLKNSEQSNNSFVKIIRKTGVFMKNNYNTKVIFSAIGILLLVLISFGFYSISPLSSDSISIYNFISDKKVKAYSFATTENEQTILWTVVIRNGNNIESLYKNDDKLSDSEIDKYKDMVLEHAKNIYEGFNSKWHFSFPDSSFYFNQYAFKEQMEKLKERMKNFKYDFNFDNENFKKMMDQIKENTERLKNENFFDEDKLEKMSQELSEAFKDHNFDVHVNYDFDKLDMNLDKLKMNIKGLKIDMSHLNEKMEELKEFMHDVKSELIKDGYLDKNDDEFDLEFTKDKIEVNGKRLPDNLLGKYKTIYKDHFGKEIDDRIRIMN